jgi:hypothetical protein
MVRAEIERCGKGTADGGEALDKIIRDPGKQELVRARVGCCAITPLKQ